VFFGKVAIKRQCNLTRCLGDLLCSEGVVFEGLSNGIGLKKIGPAVVEKVSILPNGV
jgi:hypothetical protein